MSRRRRSIGTVGDAYVPVPFQEMLIGNKAKQAAYDKSDATLNEMSSLYDESFIEKDTDILEAQESELNVGIEEMIESVGGDLGKLTGAFTSLYRKTASNKTLRNATAQQANRMAFGEELRKAKLDPGMAQYYLNQADEAYPGADKGTYSGVSYSNIKQKDIRKELMAAGKNMGKKVTVNTPGYIYNDQFITRQQAKDNDIDVTGLENMTMPITTVQREPLKVQEQLMGLIEVNPAMGQSMFDFAASRGQDFESYVGNFTGEIGNTLLQDDYKEAKPFTLNPTDTNNSKSPYTPLSLSGGAKNIPTSQYTMGTDEEGQPMEVSSREKVNQLMGDEAINMDVDRISSEKSLWMLALQQLEKDSGREVSHEGFVGEAPPLSYEHTYELLHGEGSYGLLDAEGKAEYAEFKRITKELHKKAAESPENREKAKASLKAAEQAAFNSGLDSAMEKVLKDATIELKYDLLDEETTSGEVKHIIKSLNLAAETDFEGLGLHLQSVNNKGDSEGSRAPTDGELQGNMSNINVNEFSKRPIYDAQKGITGYSMKGTFENGNGDVHTFEAVIPTNNPLLTQIYNNVGLPPVTETSVSLGKLMVKGQVVVPPKLEAMTKELGTPLGVYAHPKGGYYIVELDGNFRPKTSGNGKIIVIGEEKTSRFSTINEIAQYIEEQ